MANVIAPGGQDLVGAFKGGVQLGFRGLARREAVHDRLETQDQALDALQQRIVELAGDPLALGDPLLQPALYAGGQLAHAKNVERPEDQRRDGRAQEQEPAALYEGRRDREVESGAFIDPDAVAVRPDYLEALTDGSQAGVEG